MLDGALVDYCFGQSGLVVIPIEHLSATGVGAPFAEELAGRGGMSREAVELFDAAFGLYWQRAQDLCARSPGYWFPPRVQHVCLVTGPDRVRPYFQPFHQNSWLMYVSDFEQGVATLEYAAYQFLHVERMGMLRQILPALAANLSYFLLLTAAEREDFAAGCRSSIRPDAAGFAALGEIMPLMERLYHDDLRRPLVELAGLVRIDGTGLLVPSTVMPDLEALQRAWGAAAMESVTRHRAFHSAPSPTAGEAVCNWLAEAAPPLLVTGAEGRVLWAPSSAVETSAVKEALSAVTASAEESLLADLEVVGRYSRRFLDCLTTPEGLVDPAPYITEGGLSYIHKDHKLVAYNIGPGENEHRLWQPSPPYERFMLAARTVHEWGHLAAESGWVAVPPELKAERRRLMRRAEDLFQEIHLAGSHQVKAIVAQEVASLEGRAGTIGAAIMKSIRQRIEDYMANLLAKQFLSADEMDTYVRNNVSCHLNEYRSEAMYQELARYAYELQYLRLTRIDDPMHWFITSTWFAERFIDTGIVTVSRFEALVGVFAQICDLYRIDESKFDFGRLDYIG